MILPAKPIRHHAVSMELAAYLDERYVEMHVVTEAGEELAIVCDRDSILAVQWHIAKMARECPEIATWRHSRPGDGARIGPCDVRRVDADRNWSDGKTFRPGKARPRIS